MRKIKRQMAIENDDEPERKRFRTNQDDAAVYEREPPNRVEFNLSKV